MYTSLFSNSIVNCFAFCCQIRELLTLLCSSSDLTTSFQLLDLVHVSFKEERLCSQLDLYDFFNAFKNFLGFFFFYFSVFLTIKKMDFLNNKKVFYKSLSF